MSEKRDYEVAIDEYEAAAKEYKALEERFISGDVAAEISERHAPNGELIKREFQSYVELLKTRLEDLNSKLAMAKNAFRHVAQLGPNQERGPEGEATTFSYGSFSVQSATRRSLNAEALFKLSDRYGITQQLLALTTFDKDGKQVNLIKPAFDINYPGVVKWLQANGFNNIINGAYEEKEETPRVTGAKPLAFLGEKIEK